MPANTPKRPARRRRTVSIDGFSMTPEQVESIADGAPCRLAREAERAVRDARATVDRAVRGGERVYGVNTGFGHLATVRVDDGDLEALQHNLIRSHCAGVGDPLAPRIVRAILALRANCLARGHSGLRVETLRRIVEFLRHDIVPVVPEQGSVGASGDLAPLAHVALALTGEGEVLRGTRRVAASTALRAAGLAPVRLGPKEGLALINGTQVMTAIGILAMLRAERLAKLADVAGAMTLEASLGSHRTFDARVHEARPQPGQALSASNARRLLAGGSIASSHADCDRVQDAYSLRCMPQVHGAARDGIAFARSTLETEINASTDNPMVFADDGSMVSAGNFHGQPVAMALDHLALATHTLGTISERRIERLLNPDLSSGLPAFLAREPGLHSGFMIAHVTASALVSENKVLCHPASADTIPTSAAKEDHVSMGVTAARKALRVVGHVETVLGIEVMCAAQALEQRKPLKPGAGIAAAARAFRRRVPALRGDRVLAGDLERAAESVRDGAVLAGAERAVGPLD